MLQFCSELSLFSFQISDYKVKRRFNTDLGNWLKNFLEFIKYQFRYLKVGDIFPHNIRRKDHSFSICNPKSRILFLLTKIGPWINHSRDNVLFYFLLTKNRVSFYKKRMKSPFLELVIRSNHPLH